MTTVAYCLSKNCNTSRLSTTKLQEIAIETWLSDQSALIELCTFTNQSFPQDGGLSSEELDEFVDRITVNGKLKYPSILIQCEDFPEDLAEEQDR